MQAILQIPMPWFPSKDTSMFDHAEDRSSHAIHFPDNRLHDSCKPSRESNSSGLRRGVLSVELLVAASLVLTMIGILSPLSASCSRVWREGRQARLAQNELVNQLERLTNLNETEVVAALDQLTPSVELESSLPGLALDGVILDDNDGRRIRLSIQWTRSFDAQPLSMIAWMRNPVGDQAQPEVQSTDGKESL